MAKGSDYRIKKLEKGPLQRFKNQNLIIKKFGEVGLQVYKAITGKRTTRELQKDLAIEPELFDRIINYLSDAGMIELEPTTGSGSKVTDDVQPRGGRDSGFSKGLEDISPEADMSSENETPPLEEDPNKVSEEKKSTKKKSKTSGGSGGSIGFEEIKPIDLGYEDIQDTETAKTGKDKKKAHGKYLSSSESDEENASEPFGEETAEDKSEGSTEETEESKSSADSDTGGINEESEEIQPVSGEDETAAETTPSQSSESGGSGDEGKQESSSSEEDINIAFEEPETKYPDQQPELSPVEKIISDKYGDIGLQVYSLIDGQRTAEEIMRQTGLTEQKLVEILDFMDEQGIIKLDYPKGGKGGSGSSGAPPPQSPFNPYPQQLSPTGTQTTQRKDDTGFVPMIEGDDSLDEARAVPSPVETPVNAPVDIVKSVQFKAKLMFKFSNNKGSRVAEQIDGKSDLIDIALKLDLPLYEVSDILRFMLENGMVIMKPLSRADVRKKYGDDGYAVYKKFGKEGLMLYELIGKELTIRQMADKITTDSAKIIDMFIFIHKVLGIELPIDKEVLAKQLGT